MRKLFITLALLATVMVTRAQGLPFMQNYSYDVYHADSRNFDITTDDNGFVFVANFEGLLYYDQAEWRIIHTPKSTRVTSLYRDQKGTIWVGGLNYLGYVEIKSNGEIGLQNALKGSFEDDKSVVYQIWEEGSQLLIRLEKDAREGNDIYYALTDGQLKKAEKGGLANELLSKKAIDLGFGMKAEATDNEGVRIIVKEGKDGEDDYTISEVNGLCSNIVHNLAYNGKGSLWGATENGIFCINLPTAFTHATTLEGLRGKVLSIVDHEGMLYVGTSNGLFYKDRKTFKHLTGIDHQCFQIVPSKQGLLAATQKGLYQVSGTTAKQLNDSSTMCIKVVHDGFYTGEAGGVFFNGFDGRHERINSLNNVSKIFIDENQDFLIQNVDGTIWRKKSTMREFQEEKVDGERGMIVPTNQKLLTIGDEQTEPIPYSPLAYMDDDGVTWLTNLSGDSLFCMKDNKRIDSLSQQMNVLSDFKVRSMLHQGSRYYMGGDFGLIVFKANHKDPITLNGKPELKIRTVKLRGDSILWGGYGKMPTKLPTLASDERHLEFTFALDNNILIKKTFYRYRMDNRAWSAWDDEQEAKFPSLEPGTHKFEVQSRDAYGNISAPVSIEFEILAPFYMRWYMNIFYLILASYLIYLLVRFRLRRLEKEKMRLESIVQERTAEVVKQKDEIVKQKDEIEEKSRSLVTALHELSNAQDELIRQEKMATVGKLTQGLIDRILNPLNYINNFAKLSEGLVKDIEANIEDDKDNMDEENYEDTMDVLNMLRGNLQKVGEHGANTTRTLKAMEEMLKDRTGGIVQMDLNAVLKQDEEMMKNYYADDISNLSIDIHVELPDGQLTIDGNAEQLSKTVMSLLGNAIYALNKKAQRQSYKPEIKVKVTSDADKVTITFRDNGIGIEDTIIKKVFDPFFTTKPTGEASGVGLYLSREIIQNHGGDISVRSVKDEYTEFIITLPKRKRALGEHSETLATNGTQEDGKVKSEE